MCIRDREYTMTESPTAHSPDERALVDKENLAYRVGAPLLLSLIHISEPTRLLSISYAVFCLKKKTKIS
mgnify:CR=1 FL=1